MSLISTFMFFFCFSFLLYLKYSKIKTKRKIILTKNAQIFVDFVLILFEIFVL